jgi:hypothetical protein
LVLFVIDLKSRRAEIAGIVHQPHEAWMKQVARNLTDAVDGFLRGKYKLIHDRDTLFSAGFSATLGSDVTTIKLPVKSPNLNAYAERFVLSIKRERPRETAQTHRWHAELLPSGRGVMHERALDSAAFTELGDADVAARGCIVSEHRFFSYCRLLRASNPSGSTIGSLRLVAARPNSISSTVGKGGS